MGLYRNLLSDSGQAVIEYLLILVVTVGITLGVVLQFNKAFQTFADNYFGNYLACLLETGELPSLGLDGPDNVGICNEEFQAFSFTAGRPPVSNNNEKFNSVVRTGSSQGNGDGQKVANSRNRFRSKGGKSGGSGRGDGSGFGSRIRSERKSSSGGDGFSSPLEESADGNGSFGVGSIKRTQKSGNNSYGEGRAIRFKITSKRVDKKEEKEEEKIKSKAVIDESEEGGRRGLIPIREPQKEVAEVEMEEFNWMDYLRLIIIAGILIALFMLLAGQAVQIGKSAD